MPDAIEKLIMSHPSVEDAAVLGLPSLQHGELPLAYVVKKIGHDNVTDSELLDFVNGKFKSNNTISY